MFCFDDEGGTNVQSLTGNNRVGNYKAKDSITMYDGRAVASQYTLEIYDDEIGDSGTLYKWELRIFTDCQGTCPDSNGDGYLDPEEACDDGNTISGDGCSSDCLTIEPGYECPTNGTACNLICGNNNLDPGEECDGPLPGFGCDS